MNRDHDHSHSESAIVENSQGHTTVEREDVDEKGAVAAAALSVERAKWTSWMSE